MLYRVRILVTEQYSVWVSAEDDDAAKNLALDMLSNGEVDMDYEHVDTSVVDTDEDE